MRSQLELALLGNIEIRQDGSPVTGFKSGKSQALLCYLAVTGRPHLRPSLAGLLWGDLPEASARNNLRKTLTNLRQLVGPHLSISRQAAAFNLTSSYWLDVAVFEAQVGGASPEANIGRLEEAVGLYRGDFLEGFYVRQAPAFEEWALAQQARLRELALQALHRLAAFYVGQGEVGLMKGIDHTTRLLALEPWREEAHRQLMLLLAHKGQRSAALAQFETCRQVLAEELGVEPGLETTDLYEQIRHEKLPRGTETGRSRGDFVAASVDLPAFLSAVRTPSATRPSFVTRERELARLEAFLDHALAGQGQVVFVAGEAGSGKTALVQEFTRQAHERNDDLVVVSGNCNAYAGIGDPYLPFREILTLLTGDVEARWASGTITRDHAQRLWRLLPAAAQALADYGPDLIDTFVSRESLINRAAAHPANAMGWLERLQDQMAHKATLTEGQGSGQSRIFEAYADVLTALATRQALLLVLDDLHWADSSSLNLLFYLGRRIGQCRILVIGTYRPEDIALGRDGQRHPFEDMIGEFKRHHGDIWVDLDQVEKAQGEQFVEALLDITPNRLNADFRQTLFRRTQGHALFTIELFQDMQQRSILLRDEMGRWIEGPELDWGTIPTKVEGVIERRIGRLEENLHQLLSVASVEGEEFTAQVVADVQAIPERSLLRLLSQELMQRHRLVRELEENRVGRQLLSRYRFAHVLFQQYVYRQLSSGERRLLHGEVAAALETLYGDEVEKIVVQLAHHFSQAEIWTKAFGYLRQAGDNARQVYASHEAIAFYTQALEVSGQVSPALGEGDLMPIYEGRGLVRMLLTQYDEAIADFQMMRQVARASGNQQKEGESLCHLAYAHWLTFSEEHTPFVEQNAQQALQIARQIGDQKILARSLTSLGSVDQVRGNLVEADRKVEQALKISRQEGYRDSLAHSLLFLCMHAYFQGNFQSAIELGQEGVAVSREIQDGFSELHTLAFLCQACWSVGNYAQAFSILRDGMSKAKERKNTWITGRLMNTLGWFLNDYGDFSGAVEHNQESLELGRSSGISNVELSALINLGHDHLALGQYELARSYFEPTLDRVQRQGFGVHKWRWDMKILIGLAELFYRIGDSEQALYYSAEAIKQTQVTPYEKYVVKGRAIRGKILLTLKQWEAGGRELQEAFKIGERIHSPSLFYPLAYELGQWHESVGQEQEAAKFYGQAKAAIERMATSVADEALRSIFLESAQVRAINERLTRTR